MVRRLWLCNLRLSRLQTGHAADGWVLATESETVLVSMARLSSRSPEALGSSVTGRFFDEHMPGFVAYEEPPRCIERDGGPRFNQRLMVANDTSRMRTASFLGISRSIAASSRFVRFKSRSSYRRASRKLTCLARRRSPGWGISSMRTSAVVCVRSAGRARKRHSFAWRCLALSSSHTSSLSLASSTRLTILGKFKESCLLCTYICYLV